jgi:hypothetical protein
MELAIKLSRDEINDQIPYPVIVECWEKKATGPGKRKYYAEFNEKERMSIGMYYPKFRKWYLVTGVPDSCTFLAKNLPVLQKAGNFFANL